MLCLKEIKEAEKQEVARIATGIRVGYYADKSQFRRFINRSMKINEGDIKLMGQVQKVCFFMTSVDITIRLRQAAEAITFLQRAGFNTNQILQSLEDTLNLE